MKEKSCGAIVYKKENNKLEFLLVYQSNGNYGFPKGHMEDGETELETTVREIKEETNLDVDVDENFRCETSYLMEAKNVIKEVVYFVAIPNTFDLKNQEGEINECNWYNYDEVKSKLKFENVKEIFSKAYNYIKEKESL